MTLPFDIDPLLCSMTSLFGEDGLALALDQHERWVQALGRRGTQAVLVGHDLRPHPLHGRQLTEIVMAECDLSGMDLSGCDLVGAFLNNSLLRGCDLSGALLACTHLAEADFTDALLRNADLTKLEASWGTSFERADLRGATLTNAYLDRVRFDGAKLEGCCLDGVTLSEVYLVGANLRGLVIPDRFDPVSAYVGEREGSTVRLEGDALRDWLIAEAARPISPTV